MRILALSLLAGLVACAACHEPAASPAPLASKTSDAGGAAPRRYGRGQYIARLQREAAALMPVVSSPLARRFLAATRSLTPITTRTVNRGRDPIDVDEERYFDGDVSSPLHYARPLDITGARDGDLRPGSKVLDFGYGSIGHLRLLASLGLDVTGIEVKPELIAYYGEPGDTGAIPGATATDPPGRLRVLDGFFPKSAKLRDDVGTGYALVLAKNTLKKGYIHPDRPAPEKWLIHLGVDDATFLKTFHDLLLPQGRMLVYNIFVPIPLDRPFKPMSDGRSPFTKEQWEAAGFAVESFDQDDTDVIGKVLRATSDPGDDPELEDIHALYTLVRRRD
jgi:hypothetical protein